MRYVVAAGLIGGMAWAVVWVFENLGGAWR